MKKNERMRDKYPIFGAFGAKQTFISNDEMVAASRDERIRSIWPFVVRKTLNFQGTLKPRERVNFDAEDVLAELWVAIAEKDDQWTPERGRYITFAGVIIDRALHRLRDRSRTVESPKNSTCRTKEYAAEDEAGSLTDERRKTMGDIRRTKGEIKSIVERDSVGDGTESAHYLADDGSVDPLDAAVASDIANLFTGAVREAFLRLTAFECMVAGKMSGLGGFPPLTAWEISFRMNFEKEEEEIRRAASSASQKIRRYLLSVGHPATKTS